MPGRQGGRRATPLWQLAVLVLAVAGAGGTGLYWLSEARRLHAHLRQLEQRNRALERQLGAALAQQQEIQEFVAAKTAELKAARQQRRERLGTLLQPMPEGVRLVVAALNECLAADGYPELEVLHAVALEGDALCDVELLDRRNPAGGTVLSIADRLVLRLDRERGAATLRMFDGHRWVGGQRLEHPPEGFAIHLGTVAGPLWEARLGHMLEVVGEYPERAAAASAAPDLDPATRALWLARFERLLDGVKGSARYRVDRIDAIDHGVFTGVLLLGYDSLRLQSAFEAARMEVVVDSALGTVALLLHDGVVRRRGGTTPIGPAGYSVLLPGVSREQAMEAMLGMVVTQ